MHWSRCQTGLREVGPTQISAGKIAMAPSNPIDRYERVSREAIQNLVVSLCAFESTGRTQPRKFLGITLDDSSNSSETVVQTKTLSLSFGTENQATHRVATLPLRAAAKLPLSERRCPRPPSYGHLANGDHAHHSISAPKRPCNFGFWPFHPKEELDFRVLENHLQYLSNSCGSRSLFP